MRTSVLTIQPGYFRALGIPLVRGGEFDDTHRAGSPSVVVINESLARAYFPGEDPLGKRLTLESWTFFGPRTLEIVGVAADVKHRGSMAAVAPLVYLPLAQYPRSESPVVMKTTTDPLGFVSAVRAAVRALDRDLPIDDIQTLESRVAQSLERDRFSAALVSVFAILAVTLAAGGLFGVLSYAVSQRTRELGIRIALGAKGSDVVRLVLGHGLKAALAGLTVGVLGALGMSHAIEALLFGVSATDLLTLGGVTLVLGVIVLLACWVPARKATKSDPVAALRFH